MKTYQHLHRMMGTIKKLRQLKKDVDPASGMTIRVRRGCESDQSAGEWITLTADPGRMDDLIDVLILHTSVLAQTWAYYVQNDVRDGHLALDAYVEFLEDKK